MVANWRGGYNLENYSCLDGYDMNDCESVKVFNFVSEWLRNFPGGAQHESGKNMTSANGRHGCAVQQNDTSQYCKLLLKAEMDQTANIIAIFICYIAGNLGIPVLYFNFGVWAATPIMKKVKKALKSLSNVSIIEDGVHMMNWNYWAFGNPTYKKFENQLVSVTNSVKATSIGFKNFFEGPVKK